MVKKMVNTLVLFLAVISQIIVTQEASFFKMISFDRLRHDVSMSYNCDIHSR